MNGGLTTSHTYTTLSSPSRNFFHVLVARYTVWDHGNNMFQEASKPISFPAAKVQNWNSITQSVAKMWNVTSKMENCTKYHSRLSSQRFYLEKDFTKNFTYWDRDLCGVYGKLWIALKTRNKKLFPVIGKWCRCGLVWIRVLAFMASRLSFSCISYAVYCILYNEYWFLRLFSKSAYSICC